mmetsp:Transcript_26257/g.66649  ORF Transcript_26257/g.66649 Transcript_26257/m.66649 type:complete len:82 (-) Transcript_26257:46-291(-)
MGVLQTRLVALFDTGNCHWRFQQHNPNEDGVYAQGPHAAVPVTTPAGGIGGRVGDGLGPSDSLAGSLAGSAAAMGMVMVGG